MSKKGGCFPKNTEMKWGWEECHWEVPMLNALDCWMSFCILILVAGTALYVEPVSEGL